MTVKRPSSDAERVGSSTYWSYGDTQIQVPVESIRPGCLQHRCQHVASDHLQMLMIHATLVLHERLPSMLFHLQFVSIWLT